MQPDHAVIVPPGGGVRFGNVEFLGLSEHIAARERERDHDGAGARRARSRTCTQDEDDVFYVLDGRADVRPRATASVPAPAGTFVLVPPGVEHTFANRTAEPVRVLNIHAPAGFDRRLMGD